jgi:replication factor A1
VKNMKISDIKIGMNNINIQAKIINKSDVRNVQTRYGPKTVAEVILEDDSGQISLSLWENDINVVSIGDVINISGAYTTQFKDRLQLNIPRKTGRIEIVK